MDFHGNSFLLQQAWRLFPISEAVFAIVLKYTVDDITGCVSNIDERVCV